MENIMQILVEYGMLSDEKFYERSQDFSLHKTVDDSYYTIDELKNTIEHNQKDKKRRKNYMLVH